MNHNMSNRDDSAQRFWDHYIKLIHDQDVNPPADRWYVKHAEGYIRSFWGKKVLTHTPDDINGYFKKLARNPYLKD